MPKGKCAFNDRWLDNVRYKQWLVPVPGDGYSARCTLCKKTFGILSMGEPALKSHAKGAKHRSLTNSSEGSTVMEDFCNVANEGDGRRTNRASNTAAGGAGPAAAVGHAPGPRPRPAAAAPAAAGRANVDPGPRPAAPAAAGRAAAVDDADGQPAGRVDNGAGVGQLRAGNLTNFASRNDCLKAEVIWSMKVIKSHYSYNSCSDISQTFQDMFPDSNIVKKFTCGERKCSYLACYGVAPHFKDLLAKTVRDQDSYVLLFDESLNHKTKNKQMDLHTRIWSEDKVITRYFGSTFMGHATAENMVEHIENATKDLNMQKLLQISMDGPNVNWKFHRLFQKKLTDMYDNTLIDIGSCGLHIVHGAFRDGAEASGWGVGKLLSCLFTLFNDTPARREDFTSATKSSTFPLKFCSHRWVENISVAQRAINIWESVKTYVSKVEEKLFPNPGTASYDVVKGCCSDKLMLPKLQSFVSIANVVEPFLKAYQTDVPMLPFLGNDMFRLMKALMRRFLNDDIMTGVTKSDVMTIDVTDTENHAPAHLIEIGFEAEAEMKKLYSAKKVSSLQVMELRQSCKSFLVKLVGKLTHKAPLKYPLVKYMVCLDPREMARQDKHVSVSCLKNVVRIFNDANRIQGTSTCDQIVQEYREFLETVVAENHGVYSNFKPSMPSSTAAGEEDEEKRVDTLLCRDMGGDRERFGNLWGIVQSLLLLSHGQATVERGFSINKEIEVENLHEESLVAQRLICDHISSVGGLHNVVISKQLLVSAATARQRYDGYLEQQRQDKLREEGMRKRKHILDEIEGIKSKKKRLETDIGELLKSSEKYADKAETTGQLTYITKSNSLRKTANLKKETLKAIAKELEEKVESLKT